MTETSIQHHLNTEHGYTIPDRPLPDWQIRQLEREHAGLHVSRDIIDEAIAMARLRAAEG